MNGAPTVQIIAAGLTALYGLISLIGGYIGYAKAGSTASLIAGGVSGILLLLLAAGVCSLLALQTAWAINTAIKNSYQTKYVAAMEVLKQNSLPSSLIMGSADVGFALKFPENLTDDTTLGYTTGKKPDFIVVEDIYYQQSFRGFASRQPELFKYVSRLLTDQYRPIYNEESFKIYKRADAEGPLTQRFELDRRLLDDARTEGP